MGDEAREGERGLADDARFLASAGLRQAISRSSG
jgi:hypothetical protein